MNNLLKIDYIECMKNLMREAFSFKKYKVMNLFLAVVTAIIMVPFIACSLVFAGIYMCVAFFHRVITAPIRALHGLVNAEGKDVRHAPQTVIYIISWPAIFFLYFLEAMAIPTLTVLYAITSVFTYIWTLGGYKFHVFPEKSYEMTKEVNGKYNVLPIVFVSISALILILIPLIHMGIDYGQWVDTIQRYGQNSRYYTYSFNYYPIYLGISCVFSFFYSIFGFAPRPKGEKKEETEK